MFNPYQTISEILSSSISNERTRSVLARRFGLESGDPQTLEEIGKDYSITRERVRQIEANGLRLLSEQNIIDALQPHFSFIQEHIAEHGDIKKEETLLKDLSFICFPVISPQKELSHNSEDASRCRAALNLILVLGENFLKEKENNKFHPFWTINKNSIAIARKAVDFVSKLFQKMSKTLEFKDLHNKLQEANININEKALRSYLDVSKEIGVNKFGEFGLAHWPEISPKGVRDKAYLVLKKHGRPLHFSEITDQINQHNIDHKKAQVETVHNELIKDPRFVLIGRGVYALSDWGYQPGTVNDIIASIIKANGPLAKGEIISKVLEQRMIKENTILINLQNKMHFVRDKDGRYSLKT